MCGPGHTLADTATVTGVIAVINVPVMLIWAGFGAALREALQAPGRIRIFNIVMGAAAGGQCDGAFAHMRQSQRALPLGRNG